MIEHSPTLNELAAALAKAQAIIATARKDSQNPFFRSSYADLASVWEACRGPLTENGLSVAQFPGFIPGNPPVATVTTVLLHSSGQWISETAGAPLPDQTRKDGSVEKANAQGVGSAITYLRRYALAAVASVSPADDDGNAASNKSDAKSERGGTNTAPKGPKSGAASIGSGSAAPTAPARPPESGPLSERPRVLDEKQPDALKGEDPDPPTWPFGSEKGRVLTSYDSEALVEKRNWLVKKRRRPDEFASLVQDIDDTLAQRGGE